MGAKTFSGGVHSHDFKHYSKNCAIETMPLPEKVRIPLSQHIGAPAKPIVKVGDSVLAGQAIAEAGGFVSIPMHASISGKVTAIDKFAHPGGGVQMAIEITSDGEDKWVELANEPNYLDLPIEEIKNRIKNAGVNGMGGAGFPTFVKVSPPADKPIDSVILNGVECEPFLTADHRVMLEQADEVIAGLKLIMKAVGAKKGYIGIELNKPDAIKLLKEKTKSDKSIEITPLKLKYPQGAEKQLIYACTRRKVPNRGGLPMNVGVVVNNVGTAVAVYEAVRYKKPLIDRVITVTGPVVKTPKNIKARIGTSFESLVDFCDGVTGEIAKAISGGPMMGFAIPNLEAPMAKTSSGLLLFNKKFAAADKEHACIRCGGCVDVCPLKLVPSRIVSGVKYDDLEMAKKGGLLDCLKCGSCAFVCPAHIKIVQWVDLGKQQVWQKQQAEKEK